MTISYDKASRYYDVSRRAGKATAELLGGVLKARPESRILELGCGTGNFTIALRHQGAAVIGLDKSLGMLGQAHAKSLSGGLVCGDATRLPFGNVEFDGAYTIQVLHHIDEKELFFSEAARVLRPGSTFAVQSCAHDQLDTFYFYHYFPGGLALDKARVPDVGDILDYFQAAGFTQAECSLCAMDEFQGDRPERYLDESFRAGLSTFAILSQPDIEAGCERLRRDIASGRINEVTQGYRDRALRLGGQVTLVYGKSPR